MSVIRIIGIVLLVVGVVVLVFGAYNLISYNSSTGGKISNKVAGFFGKRTKVAQNSIYRDSNRSRLYRGWFFPVPKKVGWPVST